MLVERIINRMKAHYLEFLLNSSLNVFYYLLRSIVNQSTTNNTNTIKEMPNTTYDIAICNMKDKTTDILVGQFDMESWKTLMKNLQR